MDLVSGPGRAIGRDIAAGEAVEHEIDAFISRRDKQRRESEGDRPDEESWAKSERRPDAHRRAELRAAWYGWHMDQAERHRRNLAALVAQHEAAAERLMQANRRTEDGMSELPDTSWDRDYRKRTQECIDAKAQAAGRPSPRMLPASGGGMIPNG